MLDQDYGGQEHSSSGTTLKTDIHGKLPGFISISDIEAKVTYPEVHVGGSAYPVAHGMPSGNLPELTVKIRKSTFADFEQGIRDNKGFGEHDRIELAGVQMHMTLTSAPFDENGSPLPTRVREFNAIYSGHSGGADRGQNEAMTINLFFKQSSPAEET